jgi:hypothetical protein
MQEANVNRFYLNIRFYMDQNFRLYLNTNGKNGEYRKAFPENGSRIYNEGSE